MGWKRTARLLPRVKECLFSCLISTLSVRPYTCCMSSRRVRRQVVGVDHLMLEFKIEVRQIRPSTSFQRTRVRGGRGLGPLNSNR
jgi:hypothetical protein